MASPRNRRHLIVPGEPIIEKYKPHGRKITPKVIPAPASRPAHGATLTQALVAAQQEAFTRRQAAADLDIRVPGAKPGLYIQFESQPGIPLKLSSLEDSGAGIELVSVTETKTGGPAPKVIQHATVLVPDGKVKHFLTRFENYAKTEPKKKGERRYETMLDPVSSLRLATLHELWTDTEDAYPRNDESIWWEVWLRRTDGEELTRLRSFANQQGIELAERRIVFPDRIVALVMATPLQLSASIDVLNDIAEVQRAKETAAQFVDMGPEEQAEWVDDLLARVTAPGPNAPAACLLDTGITRGHPLLAIAAASADCTAVNPTWGSDDTGGGPTTMGHGTQMAGLALYGDLTSILLHSHPVSLDHRLESVKILPPSGLNPPELYGSITAEASTRIEVQAPQRRRCFTMAVTAADERDRGQPTSWSATVDALAAGRTFDPTTQGLVYLDDPNTLPAQRLFVVSAGNVNRLEVDHLGRSDSEAVHDPAQAWNALTVGAFTSRNSIQDPSLNGWEPLSPAGDLSPWSTTSVTFAKQWPLKPEVVFEGGNAARNSRGDALQCDDLSLLSTHYKPAEKSFVSSWATSAATAQAGGMAASVSAQYPELWPESIRGLMIHSAEWTSTMHAHLRGASGKRGREMLVRRYGYGVPSLARALRSANDSLTLIMQTTIQPFISADGDPGVHQMGEIQFFELPWPKGVLQDLAEQTVRLRVTLSYFIEPNPGRRGWTNRHRYASHGLRFDVKGPTESLDTFRKRLNQRALDEEEDKPLRDEPDSWFLGEQARNRGSVHSDMLSGTAADLAERGVIGIYPISGWWKDQPKRDRSEIGARYSLIVSIETDAENVDIWTPVAAQVQTPIATEIEI